MSNTKTSDMNCAAMFLRESDRFLHDMAVHALGKTVDANVSLRDIRTLRASFNSTTVADWTAHVAAFVA